MSSSNRKFWDLKGANIACREKEMSEKLFRRSKTILGVEQRFFADVLPQIDLGNVDT